MKAAVFIPFVFCACATTRAAENLPRVALDAFRIEDLRVAKIDGGRGYAFLVSEQTVPRWSVSGRGTIAARDGRVAITEHITLKPAKKSEETWTLDLRSNDDFRITGTLTSSTTTYTVGGRPAGSLMFGGDYGTEALEFHEGARLIAAVQLDRGRIELATSAHESAFAAAAAAIALRSRLLDATGAKINENKGIGLADFSCVTFTCDERVLANGDIQLGEEQVSQTIHHGRR